MRDVVKRVRYLIEGDSKQLRREFNQVDKGFSSLKKAAGALGVALSAGAFAAMVKGSLQTVDALAKTADKLGVTTEALGGMRHAAEQTGVASGTLDMALQRMTRRLAEAAQGTGEAQGALQELNLDAERLARLAPDQAFAEIAEAMRDVDNQSDRVRLAFKLFDSEGVSLVNTLALGRDGLEEMRKEAERFGTAIDREMAQKAEDAINAINRLEEAARGAGNQVAIALAPAIEDVADTLTDTDFQEGLRDIVRLVGDLSKVAAAAAGALADMEGRFDIIETFARNTPGLREVLLYGDFMEYLESRQGSSSVTIPVPPRPPITPGSGSGSGKGVSASGSQPEMVLNAAGQLVEASVLEARFRALDEEGQMMARGMAEYADQVESDTMVILEGMAQQKAGYRDLADTVEEEADKMSVYWEQGMRNIQDATADFFYDALQGNIRSFESFVDAVKSAIDRMVANWLAAQTQMKLADFGGQMMQLGLGFGAKLSGGASGLDSAAAWESLGRSGPGGFRAQGGPVFPGSAYMVGERGPELFMPRTSGKIVPNHQTGGGQPLIGQLVIQAQDLKSFTSPTSESQLMASLSRSMSRAGRRFN